MRSKRKSFLFPTLVVFPLFSFTSALAATPTELRLLPLLSVNLEELTKVNVPLLGKNVFDKNIYQPADDTRVPVGYPKEGRRIFAELKHTF